jgi:hypothetical protein
VLEGKWPNLTIDKNSPWVDRDGIDIYSGPGTPVVFHGEGGTKIDNERARKFLTVGSTYTVERTVVHAWSTDVFLREVPGERFGSSLFEKPKAKE